MGEKEQVIYTRINDIIIEKVFKKVPKKIIKNTYVVGGFVRDFIISKINNTDFQFNDIDYVVCGKSEKDMLELGFKKVSKSFPVFLKDNCEYALARTERSTGNGYNDFTVDSSNVSLEEDLLRRDLTINAIAIDYEGNIIDPYNGITDIKTGVLRHVSDAFIEDPLRIVRLARFGAKFSNFTIDQNTIRLCIDNSSKLEHINKTRIYLEMKKAITYEHPYLFFQNLKNLQSLWVIPFLNEMIGLEQKEEHHYEGDVLIHSLLVLKEVSRITDKPETRFAALFHDIGKIYTYNQEDKTFYGHDNNELIKEHFNKNIINFPFTKKEKKMILIAATTHHKFHNFNILKANSKLKLLNIFRGDKELLIEILKVVEADSTGRFLLKEDEQIVKGEFDKNLIENILKVFLVISENYENYSNMNQQQIIQHKIGKIKSCR